jgi:hypothetical protein
MINLDYPPEILQCARCMSLKFPRELQAWFYERFLRACVKAKLKWGTWPGVALRIKIYGGFLVVLKHGRIGNSKAMRVIKAKGMNNARWRKAAMEGKTRTEVSLEMNAAKKRKKYERLVAEAEARRAARRG